MMLSSSHAAKSVFEPFQLALTARVGATGPFAAAAAAAALAHFVGGVVGKGPRGRLVDVAGAALSDAGACRLAVAVGAGLHLVDATVFRTDGGELLAEARLALLLPLVQGIGRLALALEVAIEVLLRPMLVWQTRGVKTGDRETGSLRAGRHTTSGHLL